jgi:putative hydrolase of HD superfamily
MLSSCSDKSHGYYQGNLERTTMSASTQKTLALLLQANRLKTTPRTGWAQRGVPRVESVADHTCGVALTALTLAEIIPGDWDKGRILTMAILHDLAESVTGDLSLGGSRLLPAGAKPAMEQSAMDELLGELEFGPGWLETWREFEELGSGEARIVRDADRVDLLTQALVYERNTGTVNLDEFWQFAPPESFQFPESRKLIEELIARRPR